MGGWPGPEAELERLREQAPPRLRAAGLPPPRLRPRRRPPRNQPRRRRCPSSKAADSRPAAGSTPAPGDGMRSVQPAADCSGLPASSTAPDPAAPGGCSACRWPCPDARPDCRMPRPGARPGCRMLLPAGCPDWRTRPLRPSQSPVAALEPAARRAAHRWDEKRARCAPTVRRARQPPRGLHARRHHAPRRRRRPRPRKLQKPGRRPRQRFRNALNGCGSSFCGLPLVW